LSANQTLISESSDVKIYARFNELIKIRKTAAGSKRSVVKIEKANKKRSKEFIMITIYLIIFNDLPLILIPPLTLVLV
jgi:hypothetical protein